MNTQVLFSTGKDNWQTPHDFFAELDDSHAFTLDAAADRDNHKTRRWWGPGGEREDALTDPWPTNEHIWLNPPYSKGAQRWFVDRAVECARAGGYVVALLPARTDTRLWHECIWDRRVLRPYPWVRSVDFIRGRLRFLRRDDVQYHLNNVTVSKAADAAPFPSVVVHFG